VNTELKLKKSQVKKAI